MITFYRSTLRGKCMLRTNDVCREKGTVGLRLKRVPLLHGSMCVGVRVGENLDQYQWTLTGPIVLASLSVAFLFTKRKDNFPASTLTTTKRVKGVETWGTLRLHLWVLYYSCLCLRFHNSLLLFFPSFSDPGVVTVGTWTMWSLDSTFLL